MSGGELEQLRGAEQVRGVRPRPVWIMAACAKAPAAASGPTPSCTAVPPAAALRRPSPLLNSAPLPLPCAQKLLSALQAAEQVVELLSSGARQAQLEELCARFLADVQVRAQRCSNPQLLLVMHVLARLLQLRFSIGSGWQYCDKMLL